MAGPVQRRHISVGGDTTARDRRLTTRLRSPYIGTKLQMIIVESEAGGSSGVRSNEHSRDYKRLN